MNKTISLMALCAMSTISQQSLAQKGFDLGINSGLQTTTLISKEDQAAGPELDFKQKVMVPIGVSCGYMFNNRVGVGLDVIYARQGQEYIGQVKPATDPKIFNYQINMLAAVNNIPLSGTYTAQVILNCVKLPVLFRYSGNTEKKAYFNLFVGPQIDMISSVAFKINDKVAAPNGLSTKPGDLYNKMLIDGVLGLGAGINISKALAITAHLRMEYSISDVEKKSAVFSYAGVGEQKYYADGRGANHSASAGLMVGVHYKIMKKEKVAYKAKTKVKK